MRVVVAFALVAAACGLSVQGQEPAGVAPAVDASSTASSTSSSTSSSSSSGTVMEAGADVYVPAVASCASLTGDAVVCLDFDDDPKYESGNRGFNDLNFDGPEKPTLSLEESPLGPAAKKALAVRYTGTGDIMVKRELSATSTFPDFGSGLYTHVSFDVDVVIDALADYAVVAGVHFAGQAPGNCNEFAGVAVNGKREILHWQYPGTAQIAIGTYALGQPFHVHVQADPGGGAKPLLVSINGGPLHSFPAAIPYPDCNYGAGFVGNYFASQGAKETLAFRFDQFVLRGTK